MLRQAILLVSIALATSSTVIPALDLKRAATRLPKASYRGQTFADMSVVLNTHLKRIPRLSTASCANFSTAALQESVLLPILRQASPELLSIYALFDDSRQHVHLDEQEARDDWTRLNLLSSPHPELQLVLRDGLCHQAVMWFVHHLTEPARRKLAPKLVLPLLPEHLHERVALPAADADAHSQIVADYQSKVSCQQCHLGPVWKSWTDATLPLPLPKDSVQPGRERLRSCDYQNEPQCGPCDGLGGPRWGDGTHEFDPVNCTVVALPHDVPENERPRPAFPSLGRAVINGDTRTPLAVRPDPKKPGKYPKVDSAVALAWDASVRRQRYDFQHMPPLGKTAAQVYLQTEEQARSGNSSGVMVTILETSKYTPSICICMNAVAGAMDVDSFVPHSPHDPLDLPPDEGGLAYLGRIRVRLDGGDNHSAVADHYSKWAFHFLVDADKQSPSYGLPLRLYGSTGVRFIYSNWTLGDPRESNPKLFEIPKHCVSFSETCREMKDQFGELQTEYV